MSRSQVAKSRADHKGGGRLPANTPAVTQEIVPGKFNDHDWNLMLDADDGDDFIVDIVQSVCDSALDVIYKSYIQKQLIPYTVVLAKDAILQIIEWQFLARDEGEEELLTDEGWLEDEEPSPSVTDCWAQGSVPRQIGDAVTPSPLLDDHTRLEFIQEVDVEETSNTSQREGTIEDEDRLNEAAQQAEVESQVLEEGDDAEDSLPTEESSVSVSVASVLSEEASKQQPAPYTGGTTDCSDKSKTKKKYKRHVGRLQSPGHQEMTESLEQTELRLRKEEHSRLYGTPTAYSPDPAMLAMPTSCHSILKLQAGRPPGNRDVVYDEQGNVVSVNKLDPDRLPSHKVKTGFQVVDPTVEAAKAQLEAMRKGRYLGGSAKNNSQQNDSPRSFTSKNGRGTLKSNSTARSQKNYGRTVENMNPLPPPLIESMDVSPGVVVREGERVKHGARQHPRKAELIAAAAQRGLKPLTIRAVIPTIDVTDLLERQTPVLKPLVDSPTIPPISATPIY